MVVGADSIADNQWLPTNAFYLGGNSMFPGHPVDYDPVRDLLGGREDGKGEVTMLVMTDISNIYWFMAVMFTSIIGLVVITYLKLPVWKLQVAVVLFLDAIGVLLLISQLHTL